MTDVKFNRTKKFDLQLKAALVRERKLGDIFKHATFDGSRDVTIELKSETWLWEQTGNMCIEFRQDGEPSGIAATEADIWVHELRREGQTLCWLMFPIGRLKDLGRKAYRRGDYKLKGGDKKNIDNVLIRLRDILK